MKKLNKSLLRSYIGPLVLTFFIGLFVLLMQFLWKYVDDLVGKGLDVFTILKFMFYACWTFVPMALPLAVLLSSLMFFGNLGEHYELVALKAAGIPLKRSMKPLMFACIAICCLAFFFANYAAPKAYLNYRVLYHEIQSKKPALNIPEGVYYDQIDGYTIRVGKKNRDGSRLENVQIYDHTANKGNTNVTMAKRGITEVSEDGKYMVLTLFDGYSYGEEMEEGVGAGRSNSSGAKLPFTRVKFEKQILLFNLTSFELAEANTEMYNRHQKTLGLEKINAQIDTIDRVRQSRVKEITMASEMQYYHLARYYAADSIAALRLPTANDDAYTQWRAQLGGDVKIDAAARAEGFIQDSKYYKDDIYYRNEQLFSYGVEWHRKFSLSAACLILFFVGAPLGSIIRKGGMGMPVVVSVLLFILYHVISVIGEKAAIEGVMTCFWGMWLAPLIYLPFGILLTVQATTDSSFLDADTWRRWFTKKHKHSGGE